MPSTYDLIRLGRDLATALLDAESPEAVDLAELDVSLPEATDLWREAATAKAQSLGVVHRQLGAEAAALRAEAKRLTDAAARLDAGQVRVEALARSLCEVAADVVGEPKIGGLRLQANPPALAGALDEPDRWPAAYVFEVPATWRLDRAALKAALVAGAEIEGFRLTVGTSLRGLK